MLSNLLNLLIFGATKCDARNVSSRIVKRLNFVMSVDIDFNLPVQNVGKLIRLQANFVVNAATTINLQKRSPKQLQILKANSTHQPLINKPVK